MRRRRPLTTGTSRTPRCMPSLRLAAAGAPGLCLGGPLNPNNPACLVCVNVGSHRPTTRGLVRSEGRGGERRGVRPLGCKWGRHVMSTCLHARARATQVGGSGLPGLRSPQSLREHVPRDPPTLAAATPRPELSLSRRVSRAAAAASVRCTTSRLRASPPLCGMWPAHVRIFQGFLPPPCYRR